MRRDGPALPSGPSRLPVEALAETRSGATPRSPATRSRMASRCGASRGRAPTMTRSRPATRQPAVVNRTSAASRRRVLSIPRGVRSSAGARRPRSPRPAAPSSASATAWRTTSPSEWPCSRGAPGISTPPSRSGSPGPNGWRSRPSPIRGAAGPGSPPTPPIGQSCRSWAKIIRPATVCRTRVTVTSSSLSIDFAPPSTTTIVPSSR